MTEEYGPLAGCGGTALSVVLVGLTVLAIIVAVGFLQFDDNATRRAEARVQVERAKTDSEVGVARIEQEGKTEREVARLTTELDKMRLSQENFERRLTLLAVALDGMEGPDQDALMDAMGVRETARLTGVLIGLAISAAFVVFLFVRANLDKILNKLMDWRGWE